MRILAVIDVIGVFAFALSGLIEARRRDMDLVGLFVLGGVFERTRFTSKEQVPWLGNLPILGNLFKNDARKETNNELLIFVTPRILQPELKSR